MKMEWLVVLGIVIVFVLWRLFRRPKEYKIEGMTAQDIGRIADEMWENWKGD